MNKKKSAVFLSLILCSLLFVAPLHARQEETSPYREIELLTDVISIIQRSYVEEVDLSSLVQGALKGMLATLDPHSAFMPPDVYREMKIDTEGEFGGLGIEITLREGVLTIVAPIEDTPADRIGLMAGDIIVAIDDQPTKDLSIMEAVKLMRGPAGASIEISIMRDSFDKPKDFTIVREVIQLKSVKVRMLEDGYAYVRLSQFQTHTAEELTQGLEDLKQDGDGNFKGLILDLRNNPGGLLDQAVRVSDIFLSEGLIVYTQGRETGSQMSFSATVPGTEPFYPMVVLINEGSASASEIVAGALHDHDRALIMGTQSFGKGSVQTIIPLSDESGLRLTTARYFTPSGISIQALGIVPDLIVPRMEMREIPQPSGHVREQDLAGHFETLGQESSSQGDSANGLDEATRNDNQLIRALDLLKGLTIFKDLAGSGN